MCRSATLDALLDALRSGGGVVVAPTAEANQGFFDLLDDLLPELDYYRRGRIQTSPGVQDVPGSPTEYYRTVGAIIALLSTYAVWKGDTSFGLEAVSAGSRGPMSVDAVPGKFLNMGTKAKEYEHFCRVFANTMMSDGDWWGMLVLLAVHDVGKSDEFRHKVNSTLPLEDRSDDHDRVLSMALSSPRLVETLLPSVQKLEPWRQKAIAVGFGTNFQLPQLGQGEVASINLRGLLEMPEEYLRNGALRHYLYHSIFDIAGAACNQNFIYPLALLPVYNGFSTAMEDLVEQLGKSLNPNERDLYFGFLYSNFEKAYSGFAEKIRGLCAHKAFRDSTGLVLLRILALTRNTYRNPDMLFSALTTEFQTLVEEMSGAVAGPQIMLYYGPDMLRMGLGEGAKDKEKLLKDRSGENIRNALRGLSDLYCKAREQLASAPCKEYQYQLNVQPVVHLIKKAGDKWAGGRQLRQVCDIASAKSNDLLSEGIVVLPEDHDLASMGI